MFLIDAAVHDPKEIASFSEGIPREFITLGVLAQETVC